MLGGETEEKADYSLKTYKYWNDKDGDGYGDSNEYQFIGPDISGTSCDVAHVIWGSDWRMPTLDETRELRDKCSWKMTTVNGVKGAKVTGPNGNSIFLPIRRNANSGFYWSSTYSGPGGAYNLSFSSFGYVLKNYSCKCFIGNPVRPVTK